MIETIGWFFFDLFILGYVEDPLTGWSFRFPGGMQFAIYVEVRWVSESDIFMQKIYACAGTLAENGRACMQGGVYWDAMILVLVIKAVPLCFM